MNRLHPRIRVVWAVQAAVTATILGLVAFAVSRLALSLPVWVPVVVFAVFLVFGVGLALLRYRV